MSDVCAKIRIALWRRFLMDHRMEERERRTAEAAVDKDNPRPERPKAKEPATLCPLRIQGDDC